MVAPLLIWKKEKKPNPKPGLYAYKVHSANFEHGLTRFGVKKSKNIKNINKTKKTNLKARPTSPTTSLHYSSAKPFPHATITRSSQKLNMSTS